MIRHFSSGDQILTSRGGLAGTGPITLAAIVRTNAELLGFQTIFQADDSQSWRYLLAINGRTPLVYVRSTASATDVTLSASSWYLIAFSKSTGPVRPRLHVYDYAAGRWAHRAGGAAVEDLNVTTGYLIGSDAKAGEGWLGDIAIVGGWREELTDSQIEPLAFDYSHWRALNPRGLWRLDQPNVTTSIRDLSGRGGDETSRIGTTAAATSVPIVNGLLKQPILVDVGPPPPVPLATVPRSERLELQTDQVRIRHVTLQETASDASRYVLGKPYRGDWGINGELGWQKGSFSRRIGEEGEFTLELPNAPGSDGVLHRDRLLITRLGRARATPGGIVEYVGGGYRPGDEWIEIYADGADGNGLVYVGTPTKAVVTKQRITITGWDAMWLLKKTRESQAGFWHHSPRDVIEHYTGVWQVVYADDMDDVHPDRSLLNATVSNGVASITVGNQLGWVGGRSSVAFPAGATVHRAEAVVRLPVLQGVLFSLISNPSPNPSDFFRAIGAFAMSIDMNGTVSFVTTIGSASYSQAALKVRAGVDIALAIEVRHRWVYFYVDGTLAGSLPVDASADLTTLSPYVFNINNYTTIWVSRIVSRACRPLLADASETRDHRLPGAPAPGGLLGAYFDGADEVAKNPVGSSTDPVGYRLMVAPTKEPFATRVDPTLNFVAGTRWQPSGMADGNFGVRWTGAVYVDAAWRDVRFRLTVDDLARVWVGKTTGAPLFSGSYSGGAATSPWLSAQLGASTVEGGWYPIVIEYQQGYGGYNLSLEYATAAAPSTWTVLGPSLLAPYGVFGEQVRGDSHYDALKSVSQSFGYQLLLEPRSLESGQFPGRLMPRIRQGVDTAYVLDENDAWELSDAIDAENVADAIVADAAGIADPSGTAQLNAELLNFDRATSHLLLVSNYESLADITQPALLQQRLRSLLALSAAPWEEVAARSRGHRELIDSWPLPATGRAGSLTLFDWSPGDGLRLNLPSLGVVDESPRQIMGVARDFNPDGLKPPNAAFRQRPRAFSDMLRQLKREALLPRRNYQGTLTTLSGAVGSNYSGVSTDLFSRVFLPLGAQIVKAVVVINGKSDATPWDLQTGGVNVTLATRIAGVTTNGTYDVTAWVVPGQTFATLTRTSSTTNPSGGSWVVQLIVTLRI